MSARETSTLLNSALLSAHYLSADTFERVCTHIGRGPVAIYGFTSMLEFVAQRVLETGRQIRPGVVRAAWNGGEMLFPEQCELFRQAFGVPFSTGMESVSFR